MSPASLNASGWGCLFVVRGPSRPEAWRSLAQRTAETLTVFVFDTDDSLATYARDLGKEINVRASRFQATMPGRPSQLGRSVTC